jgi:hypothetical protein
MNTRTINCLHSHNLIVVWAEAENILIIYTCGYIYLLLVLALFSLYILPSSYVLGNRDTSELQIYYIMCSCGSYIHHLLVVQVLY